MILDTLAVLITGGYNVAVASADFLLMTADDTVCSFSQSCQQNINFFDDFSIIYMESFLAIPANGKEANGIKI